MPGADLLFFQEIEAHLRTFEGDSQHLAFVPAGNGKDLAANFPHMGSAPLNHVGRMGQFGAKGIIGLKLHGARARAG